MSEQTAEASEFEVATASTLSILLVAVNTRPDIGAALLPTPKEFNVREDPTPAVKGRDTSQARPDRIGYSAIRRCRAGVASIADRVSIVHR